MACDTYDWRENETKRLIRIQSEFALSLRVAQWAPLVTVFGSARPQPGDPSYEMAYDVAYGLAASGYRIITGGGPGIMEAANKGAHDASRLHDDSGPMSIAACLRLPAEQDDNPYIQKAYHFDHFHARKVALSRYSSAFVVMPGGFGTMDELFEVLTLMQTGKRNRVPVVLCDLEYWTPLAEWIHMYMALADPPMIDLEDEGLLSFAATGDVDSVVNFIKKEDNGPGADTGA